LYYQNHTDSNGMFTGDCAYSISWLRLGDSRDAEYYFNNTLLHLKPPFSVFTERIVGGIPHFITGAGGFLQNIIFGYAGLMIEESNITVYTPILPPGTTSKITIRKLSYMGNLLTISYDATRVYFVNENKQKNHFQQQPLFVTDDANHTSQPLVGTLTFPLGKFYIHTK